MTNEHDTPFHFLEKWNNTDTIIIRRHAFEMMYSRNVSEEEIEMVIRTGEIIEYYQMIIHFRVLFCMEILRIGSFMLSLHLIR